MLPRKLNDPHNFQRTFIYWNLLLKIYFLRPQWRSVGTDVFSEHICMSGGCHGSWHTMGHQYGTANEQMSQSLSMPYLVLPATLRFKYNSLSLVSYYSQGRKLGLWKCNRSPKITTIIIGWTWIQTQACFIPNSMFCFVFFTKWYHPYHLILIPHPYISWYFSKVLHICNFIRAKQSFSVVYNTGMTFYFHRFKKIFCNEMHPH